MMGPSRRVASLIAITAAACAGDTSVDPGDLELRDLLGIGPEIASAWNADQRAAARRVLIAGLTDDAAPSRAAIDPALIDPALIDPALIDPAPIDPTAIGPAATGPAAIRTAASGSTATQAAAQAAANRARPIRPPATGPAAITLDDRVARLLASEDARRASGGAEPLGVVRVALDARDVVFTPRPATTTADTISAEPQRSNAPAVELRLAPQWDRAHPWGHLPGRGLDVLSTLASDAGHLGGPLVVVPRPRLAAIAAYIEPRGAAREPTLAVNPVLLAALEPDPDELALAAALERSSPPLSVDNPGARPPLADTTSIASTGGNPYSFYGSVAECAFAQRTRCESCLAGSTCTPITDASNGNDECTALGENAGRGYFLLCINLSLAITSVDRCTADAGPGCARDSGAASSLTTLENNAGFLEDPTCAGALDACLAEIYGEPDDPFPGIDGGDPPPAPPRSTSVNCGDGCDSSNNNCTASPSCDCTGPSCNNSLSCDSACSSSNDQSGCGGNCNACTSSGGGGSTSNGGCGDSSSSSSDSCGSSSGGDSCGSSDNCGSCDSSSSSSNCGSCDSSSGGSSCGSCGSSSSGSSSCGSSDSSCGGGSSCGSGGGSKCSVAPTNPGPGIGLAMSLLWGLLPVPFAALSRRRARRRTIPDDTCPGDIGLRNRCRDDTDLGNRCPGDIALGNRCPDDTDVGNQRPGDTDVGNQRPGDTALRDGCIHDTGSGAAALDTREDGAR
jgi:hypothetical protein